MRKEFELTDEQVKELLSISKPTPAIALQCGEPPSPQRMANEWWQRIGKELGFNYLTARPMPSKGARFFTAEVAEVDRQTAS